MRCQLRCIAAPAIQYRNNFQSHHPSIVLKIDYRPSCHRRINCYCSSAAFRVSQNLTTGGIGWLKAIKQNAHRLRDVDEAQTEIVATAKELSEQGDILLADNKGDDDFVY